MRKIGFIPHHVAPRRNLLDFIREHEGRDITTEIGTDPKKWLEELNIVNQLATGRPLCGGSGIDMPPLKDPDCKNLGKNACLYLGPNHRVSGLWIKEESRVPEEYRGTPYEWTHYRLNARPVLFIHPDYQGVDINCLLPENFERTAERVKSEKGDTKRPIWKFSIQTQTRGELEVYAKGSDTAISVLADPPYFRLTRIAYVYRTSSETEMNTCLELKALGVNAPNIVGHYKSDFEQFLFLEAVKGQHPDKCLQRHSPEIIRQDAEMLASLLLAGYVKDGFEDCDDKLFDGKKLWLIDVDECRDAYFLMMPDFRKMLLNSADTRELEKFRADQRDFFKTLLQDTIYNYRHSLLEQQADKEAYIRAFFSRMKWDMPTGREIARLTTFSKSYQTLASYTGMMCEGD